MAKIDIFHYNDKSKKYKAFNINPTDENTDVFLSMTSGDKQADKRDRIALKLNKQELAFLIMQATKIYNELDEEDDGY